MKIAIASDHAGYRYKSEIINYLNSRNIETIDFGTDSDDAVDYPDYIRPAALSVAEGTADLGIVLGGSGNGEAITANRVRGIRCAVCWSEQTAAFAKQHNNANVIAIGQRTITLEVALTIVSVWLDSEFEAGRHLLRLQKIDA